MTNINFNDIIIEIKKFLEKRGKIKVLVRLNVDENYPHCKRDYTCTKRENMEEMKVSLLDSSNFLIRLFYNTGKIYSCTRTKIGKLLSIVAFKYAREGKKLFEEDIRKYNNCGTAINELKAYVDREVYDNSQYQDCKNVYKGEIDYNIGLEEIEEKYRQCDDLSVEVKTSIEQVFRNFGMYSPSDLGVCINKLISFNSMIGDNEEIDLSKIKELTMENFIEMSDESNMELVKYLLDI